MKTQSLSTSLPSLTIFLILLTAASGQAQAPQMTEAQARQNLLTLVLPPDTTLAATAVTDVDDDGHTHYLFYGDGGGEYNIDAATLERGASYAGLSGAKATPAIHQSAQQIQQTALNFVTQHFPNYTPGMFQMSAGPIDMQYDVNEYDVAFYSTAPSGADLPIHCEVDVEEDDGKIMGYRETNFPITISTTPAITRDQAVQIGQNWIAQNTSNDPVALQINPNYAGDPIRFSVSVDALLNETLQYEIAYRSVVLTIEAQTGAVIAVDDYQRLSAHPFGPPRRAAKSREHLWPVHLREQDSYGLCRGAVLTQNQVYLWSGYLRLLDISLSRQGKHLLLTRGKHRVGLGSASAASDNNHTAWQRRDGLYLPLAAVQELTSWVAVRPQQEDIVLNLPRWSARAKPSRQDKAPAWRLRATAPRPPQGSRN